MIHTDAPRDEVNTVSIRWQVEWLQMRTLMVFTRFVLFTVQYSQIAWAWEWVD